MTNRYFVGLLLLLICAGAVAKKVAGVEFPAQITVENHQKLVLSGAGVRTKYFFNIYACALYVPHGTDKNSVFAADSRKRLIMHITYKEVSGDKLKNGFVEGIEANHKTRLPELKTRMDHFNTLFSTVHRGDEIILDFIPGKGVQVSAQGKVLGAVAGDDFAKAVLDIWLGPNPINNNLKQSLMSDI